MLFRENYSGNPFDVGPVYQRSRSADNTHKNDFRIIKIYKHITFNDISGVKII